MTLSYHAQYERADRLARLEEVLGFTKIVVEVPNSNFKIVDVEDNGTKTAKKATWNFK